MKGDRNEETRQNEPFCAFKRLRYQPTDRPTDQPTDERTKGSYASNNEKKEPGVLDL